MFIWIETSQAYTDLSLYNSLAGKIEITAIGHTLKTGENTAGTSSSCALAIPSGTTVKAAYLYWAGSYTTSSPTSSPDYNVTLTRSGSTALSITADRTFTENSLWILPTDTTGRDFFGGFKDVTSYVQNNGAGTYTLSNLTVWTGAPHSTNSTVVGGWALFVVYQYPDTSTQPTKVINIYDGFKLYYSATSASYIDLTPSNFRIPSTGISGKHGYLTWEGDVGNSNTYENIYFNNNSLTSGANPLNNQFNSTITLPSGDPNAGISSSAGGDSAALGMDLDFYDISSYLKAGDTSVTTRYQTGTDMVLLNVEVVSVSNTDVADLEITANAGGAFIPGTTETCSASVKNNGPNPATSVTVTAQIPTGLTYAGTSSTEWRPSVSGSTVTWTYTGTLPVVSGTTLSPIEFTVAVSGTASGTLSTVLTVGGNTFDNQSSNNSITLKTTVAKTGEVQFTDKTGTLVDSYDLSTGSATAYITVNDAAANTNRRAIETITVTVTDSVTGDSETITLTETGRNTGIFTNLSTGLTVSTGSGSSTNDGTLYAASGHSIQVTYTDRSGTLYADEAYIPLLVFLSSFQSFAENGQVVVQWDTDAEIGTLGFYLKRLDPSTGEYFTLNTALIPGNFVSRQGGSYRFVDNGAEPGKSYTYLLTEVEVKGSKRNYGPFTISTGSGSAIPHCNASSESSLTWNSLVGSIARLARKAKTSLLSEGETLMAQMKKIVRNLTALFQSPVYGDMKISVTKTGLIYISADDISQTMGYTEDLAVTLIRTKRLALSSKGLPIAWMPAENNNGLYFYSEAPDSNYTDRNVYILKYGAGLIMKEIQTNRNHFAASGDSLTFTDTAHFEQDLYPMTTLTSDPDDDYWVGSYVFAGNAALGSITASIAVPGLASPCDPGTLTVTLKGGSSTAIAYEHHAVVTLNGIVLGEEHFAGTSTVTFTFDVPATAIQATNTVKITGVLDSGVPYSIFYLDSLDLSYPRTYAAVDGVLSATGHGTDIITVSGFTGASIRVMDITDPAKPQYINDATVEAEDNGDYSTVFGSASTNRRYLAMDLTRAESPFTIEPMAANTLKLKTNTADYLVIAPECLAETADRLVAYRNTKGFSAQLVLLDQIMDAFNYSNSHPEAIRDFLTYAVQNWAKKPRYVVLIGKGTYDYKNIQGYGDCLMPPLMMGMPDGLFPSDNLQVDISGNDGIPELAIGRLPARTDEELEAMINKIITYEGSGGTWTNRVIMIADNADEGGNFPALNQALGTVIPSGVEQIAMTLNDNDNTPIKSQVFQELSEGVLLLNYIGHGSMVQLADEDLIDVSDIDTMNNAGNLPIVSLMTCITGLFDIPGYQSLSESLMTNTNGMGAIAVWAPAGLASVSKGVVLDQAYLTTLFKNRTGTLGDIVRTAIKDYIKSSNDASMADAFILFGDPGMTIVH
jgi:uncharacterized repeat protein (TIGR01451 family)